MYNPLSSSGLDKFFKKLFSPPGVKVPDEVKDAFCEQFPDAVNPDWSAAGVMYEAVFHLSDIEQIALMDDKGVLRKLRINLSIDQAPEVVIAAAVQTCELMNAIKVTREGKVFYEIIARDKDLNRYQILISEEGALIKREAF